MQAHLHEAVILQLAGDLGVDAVLGQEDQGAARHVGLGGDAHAGQALLLYQVHAPDQLVDHVHGAASHPGIHLHPSGFMSASLSNTAMTMRSDTSSQQVALER